MDSLALGSAYFRSDALPDAEREYRAAIEVDPKLGEAHNNLAVVYMQTGRHAEADAEIKVAEKAGFRVNPQLKEDSKKRRNECAACHVRCKTVSPASEDVKKALAGR